jgi:hypothetical protein
LQLPQPILQQKFLPFRTALSRDVVETIAQTAMTIKNKQGSRQATKYVIDYFGVDVSEEFGEGYFSEALYYQLGLLFAHSLNPEKMAEYIRLSMTMPGPYSDQIFSDHVYVSRVTNDHQRRSIARGAPPILFSCMPRSASASITHILAGVFDMPVLHLSMGGFPNQYLAPSWLDMFLEGGAISQDHFGADDFNAGVLATRGLRDVFVLIRDPRAAARSNAHYQSRPLIGASDPLEVRIERECVLNFIPWLQEWIDCARDPQTPYRVHWLTYREVAADPAAVVRKIVAALLPDHPALAPYADCAEVADARIHFVAGDDEAWRAEVSQAVRERLWAACTPDIIALLDLEP